MVRRKKDSAKRKAFTLAEIIVSLALLGIIGACLLTTLLNIYSMIARTKNITSSTFTLMQQAEQKIQTMRSNLAKEIPLEGEKEYILFSGADRLKIYGYPLNYSDPDTSELVLSTLIGKSAIPSFPTPEITRLQISLVNGIGGNKEVSYYNSDLQIKSEIEIDKNRVYLTTIYQWYMSRPGVPAKAYFGDENTLGLHPVFPEDYQLIPGENRETISSIREEFRGKQLVLVATPVAESGKMGSRIVSNPVYISALPDPQRSSLLVHLEASATTVDNSISTGVSPIMMWTAFPGNNMHGIQNSDISKRPWFERGKIGSVLVNGVRYDRMGHFVSFNGMNQEMKFIGGGSSNTNGITVFAVARDSDASGGLVSAEGSGGGNSWELSAAGFRAGTVTSNLGVGGVMPGKWAVLGGSAGVSADGTCVRFSVNDSEHAVSGGSTVLGMASLKIANGDSGYAKADYAEVLVFNRALTTKEYGQVQKYLMEKYGLPEQ